MSYMPYTSKLAAPCTCKIVSCVVWAICYICLYRQLHVAIAICTAVQLAI